MYLMSCVTVRSEKAKLVAAVQRASDAGAALALIKDGVEPELQSMLDPGDEEGFSRSLLPHISRARAMKPGLTRDDFYGALACFILVFVSCLPAAVPFLIFSDPHFALRVSNFLLLGLLFLIGRKWAEYMGLNQLISGSIMVLVGLALVGVAILLGG
jgi:VIT1/CCC1 family predicted Fe2+/Mn2+ transporter